MLKLAAVGVALFFVVLAARANCTTQTVDAPDGKLVFCQTCCTGGNCVTTCF